jgi:small-conductance mechanosensitive channel
MPVPARAAPAFTEWLHLEHRRRAAMAEHVGWDDLMRWVAPWLLGAALAAAGLAGLFAASRARGEATGTLGFVTAGMALLALAWQVKRACDGRAAYGLAPLLVDDATSLVVLVALLAAEAVVGLVLAARAAQAALQTTGYALFGFGLVFIFWNVKHFFDAQER